MKGYASFFARRPWLIGLIAIAMTIIASLGIPHVQVDDQPRNLFRADDEQSAYLEDLHRTFGSDDQDCLIVLDGPGLFTARGLEAVRAMAADLRELPSIAQVVSPFSIPAFDPATGRARPVFSPDLSGDDDDAIARALAEARAHPLLGGTLIAQDEPMAIVVATLAGDALTIDRIEPALRAIREATDRAMTHAPGLRARITGLPAIRVDVIQTVRRDQIRFFIIGTLLGILVAFALFRRIAAVIVVALPPMIGAYWALGLMGLAGEPLNVINTVLPTLVVVIGFTDAVHLVVDIRRSRAARASPMEASALAIHHLGMACLLTSITTAVGFASLSLAGVEVIQRLGLACAMGSACALLAVLTLVPLFAAMTPRGWLVARGADQPLTERRLAPAALIQPFLRRARLVSVAGVIFTLALIAAAVTLKPDHRITESIPHGNETAIALDDADRAFGGVLAVFIVATLPEDQPLLAPETRELLASVHESINTTPGLASTVSLLSVWGALPENGAAMWQVLVPESLRARLWHEPTRQLLITARIRDVGVRINRESFTALDAKLDEIARNRPGVDLRLTGTTVLASRSVHHMISDLAISLGVAAIVIFFTLALAFRSLRFGLISMLPNIFPLAFTAGLLAITGQPLQITSVIVFSICLGIAVDDTIHVLARFRRERATGHDNADAIGRTFTAVGSALFTTTIVLLCGFGTLAFSEVPAIRLFALLSCVAVTAALIGDLLLLPALLQVFGPKNNTPRNE